MGDFRRGSGVNACKTLARPKKTRSATRLIVASRFELPLLGSNQDSPDPESGVLPITPRGSVYMELRGLEPLTSWVRCPSVQSSGVVSDLQDLPSHAHLAPKLRGCFKSNTQIYSGQHQNLPG